MGNYDTDSVNTSNTPPAPNRKAPTAQQLASRKKALRTQRIAIICGCVVALVVLIIVIVSLLGNAGNGDDGKILPNVYAAGINLGGMSKDEAKSALRLSVSSTLTGNSMVVYFPDGVLELSPEDTKASVDVDALVEDAYLYGRTGSEKNQEAVRKRAQKSDYTFALLPYMKDLDLEYIYNTVEDFCATRESPLSSAVSLEGVRPTYDPNYPSSAVEHQVMTITIGATDYALSADELYAQILDAYSLNIIEFNFKTDVNENPDPPNAQEIFDEFCIYPQDATKDPKTYEIIPEVQGYGFDVDEVQNAIDASVSGDKIEVTLMFLHPDITAKDLKDGVFEDILAETTLTGTDSSSRNKNLELSCQALDGVVIAPGETFSFNQTLGRPTAKKGYKQYAIYQDGELTKVVGGGIDQTASALYYCALMADLEIVEKTNNDYVVDYIKKGLDVCIRWDEHDLQFTNTTEAPIRIKASAKDNNVTISLEGTDKRNYTVNILTKVKKTYKPDTVKQEMDANNLDGYTDGTVLEEGIKGYKIEVSIERIHKQTELIIDTEVIDTAVYEKRDKVVVSID